MVQTRQWISINLANLLGASSADIDESIITNLLTYRTPKDLFEFLQCFVPIENHKGISSFVLEFFAQENNVSSIPDEIITSQNSFDPPFVRKVLNVQNTIVNKETIIPKHPCTKQQSNSVRSIKRSDSILKKHENKQERSYCYCNGQSGIHTLIGNCLSCGKIVCSHEQDGPCLYCGNKCVALVGSVYPSDIKDKQHSLYEMNCTNTPINNLDITPICNVELQKAIERKNQLLYYQSHSVERTKVYDDNTDFFYEAGNIWLTKNQREEAKEQFNQIQDHKYQNKYQRVVTFDTLNHRIIENSTDNSIVQTSSESTGELSKKSLVESYNTHTYQKSACPLNDDAFGSISVSQNKSSINNDLGNSNIQCSPSLSGPSKELYDLLWNRFHGINLMTNEYPKSVFQNNNRLDI